MPRKKIVPKFPIPVDIQTQAAPRSPHVLDLRARAEAQEINGRDRAGFSFEEKVAAADERLKEVPDFLKAQVEDFSKKFQEQREAWQKGFAEFFGWGNTLGARLQEQLKEVSSAGVRLGRRGVAGRLTSRYRQVPRAFFSVFRSERFGIFIVSLVLITLPLQGVLLYRTITTAEQAITENAADLISRGQEFIKQAQAQDVVGAHRELLGAAQALTSMREAVDAFGILRFVFPARLRFGYAALQFGEVAARSSSHILEKMIAMKEGTSTFSEVLHTASAEIRLLKGRLKPLLKEERWSAVVGPVGERLAVVDDLLTILNHLSGVQGPTRILLVFENPRELRATGGFAGSLALLTVKDGRVENVELPEGGSYDVQGQLRIRRIAPQPLHLINPRLELQDANWWPDFPTSARKISELYEATGGPTIDAVIAITAQVGEELLRVSGPLTLADRSITFTEDNFIDTLQGIIASDRAINRKAPKKIIRAVFPSFVERVTQLATKEPQAFLALALAALERKDIQAWSRDEITQAALRRLRMAGEMAALEGDYLGIISSNVGGGKTDAVVRETVVHETVISAQGIARSVIRITRTHEGRRGDRLQGMRNASYMRIYVPKGARLIEAKGFNPPPAHQFEKPDPTLSPDPDIRAQEISARMDAQSGTHIWEEQGKAVFGNWLTVEAGATVVGELIYEVPLAVRDRVVPYRLTIEPQAGKRAQLSSRVSFEPGLQLVTGKGLGTWAPAGWSFEGPLEKTVVASGVLYKL